MIAENKDHSLFCMETVAVSIFFLAQLLMFGFSRLDRYEESVILFGIFVFYAVVWGRAAFRGTLFGPFFFLTCFIVFSGYAIDGSAVDAATESTTDFQVFTYSLLGVETYFIYTSYLHNHPERYRLLKYFAYTLMFGGIIVYFYCVFFVVDRLGQEAVSGLANIIYSIMMPLPLFLFFTKENKQMPVLLAALVFAVFTAKRMALLVLAFTILLLLILYRKKNYWITILCVLAAVGGCFFFLEKIDLHILDFAIGRFENIESDQGSGRMEILQIFWQGLQDFSIEECCFGRGFGQFSKYFSRGNSAYVSAHNDLAEIMHAHGFFAAICYVWLSVRIYWLIWKMRKSEHCASFLLLGIEYTVYGLVATLFFFYTQTQLIFIMIAVLDDQYQRWQAEAETHRLNDVRPKPLFCGERIHS